MLFSTLSLYTFYVTRHLLRIKFRSLFQYICNSPFTKLSTINATDKRHYNDIVKYHSYRINDENYCDSLET